MFLVTVAGTRTLGKLGLVSVPVCLMLMVTLVIRRSVTRHVSLPRVTSVTLLSPAAWPPARLLECSRCWPLTGPASAAPPGEWYLVLPSAG